MLLVVLYIFNLVQRILWLYDNTVPSLKIRGQERCHHHLPLSPTHHSAHLPFPNQFLLI